MLFVPFSSSYKANKVKYKSYFLQNFEICPKKTHATHLKLSDNIVNT